MASNDSSAAVATVVNADTLTIPPTENKVPETEQANHESPSSQVAAAVPAAETPTSVKKPVSEPAACVTSTPTIPSPSVSAVKDLSQSDPPKPIEDAVGKVCGDLTANSKSSEKEENETSKKDLKEEKLIVEDKIDKGPIESTPSTNSNSCNVEQPVSGSDKPASGTPSLPEAVVKNTSAPSKPVATIKPMVESTSNDSSTDNKSNPSNPKSNQDNRKSNNNKRPAEDSEESEKRMKPAAPSGSKGGSKSAEEILEYMEKTFEQRRKIITKQMPTIPELKSMYPELFMGKQLLLEFQRITKIDIDQKIQEFCVRYATAVIEMARSNKAAAPVLARWEQAKQENETLKQYWDMVTALCLLPLHFGENFVEMVLEIEEDEEVKAQGKIVPTLVARGNIFRTDEFFLIAENTIVQEFEEFTIAFASLYSSYWVFNMVYPETIENTYNYIQRCIVRQREPGAISAVCKNFTKSLQKWNKEKEGK